MNFQTLTGATSPPRWPLRRCAAEIVIGLIAPLTGPVAAYGDQVKNGAQVAVDQINKNGGILGEQVVLKLADDAGEPKQGVSAANQIVGEGIRFVVGPVTSGVAMPASDVLAENGVLMVTPTATTPDLTKRGLATVLRTCGRDDQQAEVAAAYVLKQVQGQAHRHPQRQGRLRQGSRRCLQGNAERRWRHRSLQRFPDTGRQGPERAHHPPEG